MSLASAVWNNGRRVASIPRRLVIQPLARKAFASCGSPFYMGKGCDFQGIENIHVGNNVSFGPRTLIWTTRAQVYIGNDVMFGPDCSIVSGDHRTDIKGKPMMAVNEDEKRPENDQDVIIEDDCWLGGGAPYSRASRSRPDASSPPGPWSRGARSPMGFTGACPPDASRNASRTTMRIRHV